MKLVNVEGTSEFTAKQIIDHKMPKIDNGKWAKRTARLNGKFVTIFSKNNGSYFKKDGINYYVASEEFKSVDKFKVA